MIKFQNISFHYGRLPVLKNVTLEFQTDRINCIVGPSGCGKTTILNLIAGLLHPDQGQIINQPDQVSYIFQETRILPWKTVYENVIFPLQGKMSRKDMEFQTRRFLEHVSLWDKRDVYPGKLSGGMKQRVSIARAFAFPSSVILMDEAFQGLDIILKNKLLEDFAASWKDAPRTVVFVTHDLDEALAMGHQIMILPSTAGKSVHEIQIDQEPAIHRTGMEAIKQDITKILSQ